MNRRNWLLLILAGIAFSSLGTLLASAMLFPYSDGIHMQDNPYAWNDPDGHTESNEHPPCDGGYNSRYNMPFQFSPYGH